MLEHQRVCGDWIVWVQHSVSKVEVEPEYQVFRQPGRVFLVNLATGEKRKIYEFAEWDDGEQSPYNIAIGERYVVWAKNRGYGTGDPDLVLAYEIATGATREFVAPGSVSSVDRERIG